MRHLFICRGLPASGKSTWAKEQLKREPNRWKRVNKDDIRMMLDNGQFSKTNESLVRSVQDQIIRDAIGAGFDVIVDNTHLVGMTVKKLHTLAASIGDVMVIEKGFNVDVDTCLERNAKRSGSARVPDDVIKNMAKAAGLNKGRKLVDKTVFYANSQQQLVQNPSLPRAIICDLDGTLALMNGRNPYDASTCDEDLLNEAVAQCVLAMHYSGRKIIFMSGRDSKYKAQTIKFIEQHMLVEGENGIQVMPYELFMRATNDSRRDSIVKAELFAEHVKDKYYVEFAIDDRDQIVREWRKMGLICFQVAYGNF